MKSNCSNVNVIVEQIESVALCFCLSCTRRYCFVHLCSFMTDFITSPLSLNVHLHVYCLLCSVVSFVLCRLDRYLTERLSRPYEAKLARFEENLSKILKEEQKKAEQFFHQKQKKEDELAEMRVKYKSLKKEFKDYKRKHEESAEMENNITEHQTEFEKMYKFKRVNGEKKYQMEDQIRNLQTKLDHLERVGESHKFCVEREKQQSQDVAELVYKVEAYEDTNILLKKRLDELNCSYNNMKAENVKVKHLRTELDAKTEEVNKLSLQLTRLQELKRKNYSLKSDNKKCWDMCLDLERKLEDKVNELENVNGRLNRTESLSVEFKILQRDKAYVEQKNSELTRALQEKGTEIESPIKQRERFEEQQSASAYNLCTCKQYDDQTSFKPFAHHHHSDPFGH